MNVTSIVFVQHAQQQRASGDPGLTKTGRLQAADVGERLAEFNWDVLISSPLVRARSTAEIIGDICAIPVLVDARLRERMNWGDCVSQPIDEFFVEWTHANTDRAWTPRSGESSFATGERCIELCNDLAADDAISRALLVTHGGVTVDALRTIFSDDQLRLFAPTIIDDGIPACALTSLHHVGDTWSAPSIAQRTFHVAPGPAVQVAEIPRTDRKRS